MDVGPRSDKGRLQVRDLVYVVLERPLGGEQSGPPPFARTCTESGACQAAMWRRYPVARARAAPHRVDPADGHRFSAAVSAGARLVCMPGLALLMRVHAVESTAATCGHT